MAEVHVTTAGVVVHNPGQTPLHPGAGVPVTAVAKPVGQPNGVVHGQVNAGGKILGPIFHNPA